MPLLTTSYLIIIVKYIYRANITTALLAAVIEKVIGVPSASRTCGSPDKPSSYSRAYVPWSAGNVYVALSDFTASKASRLTLARGDILTIADPTRSKNWWMAKNDRGEEGKVPSNYVTLQSPVPSPGAGFAERATRRGLSPSTERRGIRGGGSSPHVQRRSIRGGGSSPHVERRSIRGGGSRGSSNTPTSRPPVIRGGSSASAGGASNVAADAAADAAVLVNRRDDEGASVVVERPPRMGSLSASTPELQNMLDSGRIQPLMAGVVMTVGVHHDGGAADTHHSDGDGSDGSGGGGGGGGEACLRPYLSYHSSDDDALEVDGSVYNDDAEEEEEYEEEEEEEEEEEQDDGDSTTLLEACYRRNYEDAVMFLDTNADPNERNEDGLCPLYIAAQRDCLDIVIALVSHGVRNQPSHFCLVTVRGS